MRESQAEAVEQTGNEIRLPASNRQLVRTAGCVLSTTYLILLCLSFPVCEMGVLQRLNVLIYVKLSKESPAQSKDM